jgi:hypothetical protein
VYYTRNIDISCSKDIALNTRHILSTQHGYFEKRYSQTIYKLKKLNSSSELYRPSSRPFSAKLIPTFSVRGCHVVSVTDPYGRILVFLDRSRYFPFQAFLSCTHEAEWTLFQTYYFSENLVELGIETGPLDL